MVSPMKKLEGRIWTTKEEEEVQKEWGRGVGDMKDEALFEGRKDQIRLREDRRREGSGGRGMAAKWQQIQVWKSHKKTHY